MLLLAWEAPELQAAGSISEYSIPTGLPLCMLFLHHHHLVTLEDKTSRWMVLFSATLQPLVSCTPSLDVLQRLTCRWVNPLWLQLSDQSYSWRPNSRCILNPVMCNCSLQWFLSTKWDNKRWETEGDKICSKHGINLHEKVKGGEWAEEGMK